MKVQCPSVSHGHAEGTFVHQDCQTVSCEWWDRADGSKRRRCTAAATIPIGRLMRKKKCVLAPRCRLALQAPNGVCPPMKLWEICEHQGGEFNTFHYEVA